MNLFKGNLFSLDFSRNSINAVLDEATKKSVEAMLAEQVKAFGENLQKTGTEITEDVSQQIEVTIQSKFQEVIGDILQKTENLSAEKIEKIVREQIQEVKRGNLSLIESIQSDLACMEKNEKTIVEQLSGLSDRYAFQEQANEKILDVLASIKKREEDKSYIVVSKLNMGWEYLKEAKFSDAERWFKEVTTSGTNDQELVVSAYFGLVLVKWKIQLIWDYTNDRFQPICHDYNITDIDNDQDYKFVLNLEQDKKRKEDYQNFVGEIKEILKYFKEFKKNGYDYDCFICVKVTDENGEETADSRWIKDNHIYEKLNDKLCQAVGGAGKPQTRTFFSEIDLKEQAKKDGIKYEASILYALSQAKCMLLVCSDEKYLKTPWVRNEYTRFCSFLKMRNQQPENQIVIVFNRKVVHLPDHLRSEGIQDYDRAGKTSYDDLVETVQNRVKKGREYVSANWKYCPVCERQYTYDEEICTRKHNGKYIKLVDSNTYLNNKVGIYREEVSRYEEEIKRLQAKLKEQEEKANEEIDAYKEEIGRLQTGPNTLDAKTFDSKKASYPTLDDYDKSKFKINGTTLVQYIGEDLFVQIPMGVQDIDESAFANCSSLTSVTIPNSVTSIGDRAFFYCSSLTSVTIGNNLEFIGEWAFEGTAYCRNGKNWKDGVLYIGNYLIVAESSISGAYTIKEGTKAIATHAFENCSRLTSVTIPNSVTSISCEAFSNCSGLTNVVIANGLTIVGDDAFLNCGRLTSMTMPNSVTNIGRGVFKNTAYYKNERNWENGVLYIGNYLIEAKESVAGAYTIKQGTKVVATHAFENCSSLTSVTIPNSVTSIGWNAFSNCSSLASVTIPNSVTRIEASTFEDCGSLTSVTIPDGVTSIGWNAFSNCSSLASVTIPNSVTSIGDYAFSGCSGLTSVTIPNSVTSIGDYAFSGCSGLTSVTIPNSVTSIGESAFSDCSGLTSVTIGNNLEFIGEWAFVHTPYYNDESNWKDGVLYIGNYLIMAESSISGAYTIKEGTKAIADNAFDYCRDLTSVVIPNSVTSIGAYAFYDCSSLTSVTLPNSVTSIGHGAFSNCSSLTSVTIPNSVTSIGVEVFSGCINLMSVEVANGNTKYSSIDGVLFNSDLTYLICYPAEKKGTAYVIPNSVASIGVSAFENCSSLTSITIPNSVTSIGESTFSDCSSLTSITIPNSVTSIGESAFSDCSSLTSITIPNNVTSIGSSAFSDCSSLTSVTISNSVKSIGGGMFSACTNLKIVYYTGTEKEYSWISEEFDNEVTCYYYSETKPTTDGNWWHYVDGVPTVWE